MAKVRLMADRTFDVVVYGATGFTGKLVAEYLLSSRATAPSASDLSWAIAGRNEAKLDAVRKDLGAPDLPIFVADSQDGAALDAITSQTRVLITTVGPFYVYGQEVVASCVRNGTHYCDLTGETHFARAMDRKHHAAAMESGARIVHNAGYDSIPSDLGAWMMYEAMQEKGAQLTRVDSFARGKGAFSGGTLDTMRKSIKLAGEDREVRRAMSDPYALYPEGEERGLDKRDVVNVGFSESAGSWVAPFIMAGTNAPIVRRSNALLGFPYGREFRYSESMTTGKGFGGWSRAWAVTLGLGGLVIGNSLSPTRWLLEKVLPKPGEGPDKATREAGYFKHLFIASGVTESGEEIELRGLVGGDKDPGYGQTAVMIAEAGLCLAFDETATGLEGGVLTPTSAMGTALIERLRTAGMTFEVS